MAITVKKHKKDDQIIQRPEDVAVWLFEASIVDDVVYGARALAHSSIRLLLVRQLIVVHLHGVKLLALHL